MLDKLLRNRPFVSMFISVLLGMAVSIPFIAGYVCFTRRPILKILEIRDEAEIYDAEQRWIRHYREAGVDLLNVVKKAPEAFHFQGPHTAEARRKIGAAQKNKVVSSETRTKISVAQQGRKQSTESNAKRSAALKGRSKSPEARRHMAAAQLERTGWKHTTETLAKMSVDRRGRPWSTARRAAYEKWKKSQQVGTGVSGN